MKRSVVLALMFSIGYASVATAGDTLLQSGQRMVIRQSASVPAPSAAAVEPRRPRAAPAAAQAPTTLGQSRMRPRNKFLIGLAIAAAFTGVALAIDAGVEDNTPSTRGER